MRYSIILTTLFYIAVYAVPENLWGNFSMGHNLFSSRVYKNLLNHADGNFVVSTISLELALGMAMLGAEGLTFRKLTKGLMISNRKVNAKKRYKEVLTKLKSTDKYELTFANRMYVDSSVIVKPKFKKSLAGTFQTNIDNIDLENKKSAVNTINDFVMKRTNQRIRDLMNVADISDKSILILVNALYFKGTWRRTYSKVPGKQKFYSHDGKAAGVDMFRGSRVLKYHKNKKHRTEFLVVPYAGGAAMHFAIPDDARSFRKVERLLGHFLNTHIPYLPNSFNLTIPKFTCESKFQLNDVLRKMHFSTLFARPNFKGIADEEFRTSTVVQKAFIEVTEKGVEAEAGSNAMAERRSRSLLHKDLMINKPFIFWLTVNDTVMFMGRVKDLSKPTKIY